MRVEGQAFTGQALLAWSGLVKRSGQAFRSSVLATRSGQAFWLRNLVMRSCAHTATKRAGVLAPNKQNTLLSTLHVCPRGSSEERLGRLAAAAAAAAAAVVGGGGSSACAGGGWHVGGAARGGDGPGWLCCSLHERRAARRAARPARVRRHGALKWHTRSVGGALLSALCCLRLAASTLRARPCTLANSLGWFRTSSRRKTRRGWPRP